MPNATGESSMTGTDMMALRDAIGWTQDELAAALGRTTRAVRGYEKEEQPIPLVVALACRAIADGWRDYGHRAE